MRAMEKCVQSSVGALRGANPFKWGVGEAIEMIEKILSLGLMDTDSLNNH